MSLPIPLANIAAAVGVPSASWGTAPRPRLPEASVPGLVMALLSFLIMPRLARAKRVLAPTLGSRAVAADADQTNLCALLSGVLLAGVGLNAVFGWWWADPVAALIIGALAAAAARRAWSAESLADTCCP